MVAMSPEIVACNDFSRRFYESADVEVRVSEASIADCIDGVLSPLRSLPYRKVRNRFRVLCSMDPVVNQKEEVGFVHVGFADENGVLDEVCFRCIFPSGDPYFIIQKVENPA